MVEGADLEFKVSGLLFESNLVMYDVSSESFWSQSTGTSIVGKHNGTKLELLPFRLISFLEVTKKYPQALVLSERTGYPRDYSRNPYGDYNKNDELYFPVSKEDARYPSKEIFYIVRNGESTVAIRKDSVAINSVYNNDNLGLTIENKDGELFVTNTANEAIPGYYEMWFSWVNHTPDNAQVWDPDE